MKVITTHENTYFLRFDKDEDLMEKLKVFCEKENIEAASFTGIGAGSKAVLGYYDLKKKAYTDKQVSGDFEIVSLVGNVSKLKEQTIVHAHACLSDETMRTVAGHVKKLVVSVTCELSLQALPSKIERKAVEGTELKLLA